MNSNTTRSATVDYEPLLFASPPASTHAAPAVQALLTASASGPPQRLVTHSLSASGEFFDHIVSRARPYTNTKPCYQQHEIKKMHTLPFKATPFK